MRFPQLLLAAALAPAFYAPSTVAYCQDFGFDILGLQNEDFFHNPPVSIVRLSATGERLAYVRPNYDSYSVFVLDTRSGERTQLPTWTADGIDFLDWLGEERLLVQTSEGSIYRQDIEGGLTTKVFDASRWLAMRNVLLVANVTQPRVLSTLPEDPEHILVSAYDSKGARRVYRLPLEEWDEEKLPEPLFPRYRNFDLWHADRQGELRLAVKIDRRGAKLFQRLGDSDRWQPFSSSIEGGTGDFDMDTTVRNLGQKRHFFLGFDFNPDRFYYASNKQSDTTAIYRYDMASESEPTLIASDPDYDLVDTISGNAAPILSVKKQAWVGFHYEADTPRTLWLDPEYESLQRDIDALLPDSKNLLINWNRDETLVVVSAVWSRRPHSFYLYDRGDSTLTLIGDDTHPIARQPGSESSPIRFTASGGHELHGYYTPAKDSGDTPAPLVLLVHGGPWARDTYAYDPFVQSLAHNGYSTLRVNFRGSTGYGYQHFSAATRDYGWAVQQDLADARQWAIEQGLARSDRVAIMGFSFGGYAAALAAASQPEAYQCAVPISGIYDLRFESKRIKEQSGRGLTYQYWKQMVGSDWKDRKRLEAISPTFLAAQIDIPLLVAHGARDPIASVEHALAFTQALKEHGKDFDYIELAEEGHSLDLPKNQAYLFDRIVGFLDQHMQTEDAP